MFIGMLYYSASQDRMFRGASKEFSEHATSSTRIPSRILHHHCKTITWLNFVKDQISSSCFSLM
jgi:hypothetical protein